MRSPAAFTDEGFRNFNEHYVKTLREWGIYDGKSNPVARSNVCPEIDPPAEPSFYAFSFTRPSTKRDAELCHCRQRRGEEGSPSYAERTVRYRDVSPEGMKEKVHTWSAPWRAAWVRWPCRKDVTAIARSVPFTIFHHALADELVKRGAARSS